MGALLPRSARLRSGSSPVKAKAVPEAAAECWAREMREDRPCCSTDRPPETRAGMASGCGRDTTHLSVRSVLPVLCSSVQPFGEQQLRRGDPAAGREGDIGHATIASPMA